MADELPVDPADAHAVADRRDEVVAAVRDHAGGLAYALARLDGGDYGQRTFSTDRGRWTLKHERGEVQYLRYEGQAGSDVYVVSTKRDPDPDALATAMGDYRAFCRAFDEWVGTLDGRLDTVTLDLPEAAPVGDIVAERDRLLADVRERCTAMADQLRRVQGGDYGSFAARAGGARWELKWDADGVSYLRVGGADGVYLLSQYGPPAVADLATHAPALGEFVAAYNEHVAGLDDDIRELSG